MQFCIFRLYAPLSSWGDIAVGMERRSYYQPSKSAVIGMVAAALGVKRYEEDKYKALFNSLGFGIKLLNPGEGVIDYHTTQMPKKERDVVYRTRRDELYANPEGINTIISRREYRCDSLSIIALWEIDNSKNNYSLKEVQTALQYPTYHLYLGRKACPPALPLEPQIKQAETLRDALNTTEFGPIIMPFSNNEFDKKKADNIEKEIFYKNNPMYFWESCQNSGFLAWTKRTEKYDRPLNRDRWQFGLRYEYSTFE